MTMSEAVTRATRSDGERSRRQILETAARLATTHGLEHLSIGTLAEEAGFSKSGMYAHFRSKEALQLATVETAEEIYGVEVYARAAGVPAGIDGLLALVDAHLDHLRRRVFPGGCFFDAAASDLAGRPGPVRDRIAAFLTDLQGRMQANLEAARAAGDLPPDTDLDLLAFDIASAMSMAHARLVLFGDDRAVDMAGLSVRRRVGR
jgi:AcrR family transcriptional regulator